MNSSINYFLNQIPSTASDYCKAYFDFETDQTSSNIVYNKTGDLSLTGIVNNKNLLFWSYNSGYFSGNTYVSISGINNSIDIKDFTLCFIYDNQNKKGSTLISTVDTGNYLSYNIVGNPIINTVYKGFNFGVTANNHLFFEYYANDGPNIFTSNFSLSDKNSIFLTITENNVAFGYFDFFGGNLISNNYYISTDYLLDYTNLYIGYNPKTNSNTYNFNRNFTGYIDELLIFSPSIYTHDIININSGLVHDYSNGIYFSYINSTTGVTGYLTGITNSSVGITGTVIIQTGTAYDEFGIENALYYESGITGIILEYGITGLTGVIASEIISGYTGQGVAFNSNTFNSFGKQKINILSTISSGDMVDINLITKFNIPYFPKNLNLNYQKYDGSFILPDFTINFNDPIVYVNGQLQHSGSFYPTGGLYNLSQYIINDYYINEFNNFIFANSYNENDSVFIDSITGYNQNLYIENFAITQGIGIVDLLGWSGNNIYFNGQKLIDGIHYTTSSSGIKFDKSNSLYNGVEGKLIGVPKFTNFYDYKSGVNFYNSAVKYFNGFSEIYKNGIRQTLDSDYLELASIDINTGVGFFDHKPDLIYNNEDLFNL